MPYKKAVGQLRLFLILTIITLLTFPASALESDDISAAIVKEGSAAVKWINDPENPWVLSEDGTYMQASVNDRESKLTMTYSSAYITDLQCLLDNGQKYWGDKIIVRVDGEQRIEHSSSWKEYLIRYIPAGEHTIEFIFTPASNYTDSRFGSLSGVMVKEYKELEPAAVKEESLPLELENDPDYPFMAYDGYIECYNHDVNDFSSTLTTTFTVDRTSIFSFESILGMNSSYLTLELIVDGLTYFKDRYSDWKYYSLIVEPGTHTVQLIYSQTAHTQSDYWCRIRNIRLDQTWYNIDITKPGELGLRLLQQLGDKNLQDAELVKITGTLNSDDWNTVMQLTGIHAIDFSDAVITEIPSKAFSERSYLNKIILPDMLITINNSAFESSGIRRVLFAENSSLITVGAYAFNDCKNLEEFIMPNTVTSVGQYAFSRCESIKTLHFSDNLTILPNWVASGCKNLTVVHFPANLKKIERNAFSDCAIKELIFPESLDIIDAWAFISNSTEKIVFPTSMDYISDYAFDSNPVEKIELPDNINRINGSAFSNCGILNELKINSVKYLNSDAFRSCRSLTKIIITSPTPPKVGGDPFNNIDKSQVEMIVPDFALASYKADPYWYQFTRTRAGEEASVKDYWRLYGNLILSPGFTMSGSPSVEMMDGSSLTIDKMTAQQFNKLTYWTSETNPALYLSDSSQATADSLNTYFYIEANKWYFFAPVCDVKMSDITHSATDSWIIRYYDGERRASLDATSGNWINMPADGVLRRGEGYIVQANKEGWLNMPVDNADKDAFFSVEQVDIPLNDHECPTEANAGWNFVANPYPTYYDIYYIDMQAPITVWTGSTYRAYSLNDGDRGDDTYVLRPMQPFFVQKADADLTLGMPLFGRQTTTVIDRNRAPRRAAAENTPERHKLNLEIKHGEATDADDYSRIVLNESASLGYEANRDASKFMSLDVSVAQIYTIGNNNQPMAINERPYADGNVALGVYLPVAGETYSIAATRIDGNAWIYDSKTGIEHDLSAGAYTFTADKAGFDNTRFFIRFTPPTTSIDGLTAEAVKVVGREGVIEITAPAGAEVAVYTVDGAVLHRFTADGSLSSVETVAGVYVVTVNGLTFKTIVK